MGWMDLVDGVGYAVDTPRALAHGLVAKLGDAVRGKPIRSNWRASGREMLESLGVLGPNQEGIDAGDFAGFGAELALDPMNLLGAGLGLKLLGKYRKPASQVADVLSQVDEAPILAERVPEAVKPVVEADKYPRWVKVYEKRNPTKYAMVLEHEPYVRPKKPKWERPDLKPGEGPFYSRLERAVEALQGTSHEADDVVRQIKAYPEGVSQEEIDWTRVADFLRGKKTVSKADLLEHVRANRPKVDIVPGDGSWSEHVQPGKSTNYQEDVFQWSNPTVTDKKWVDNYDPSTGSGGYELSGNGALVWAERAPKVDGWKLRTSTPGKNFFDTSLETVIKADSPDAVRSEMERMLSLATENRNSHFNVPNVLAHGRSTKRDTLLGRMLLGEEQQSDWFQDAMKEGYRGDPVSNPEWKDSGGDLVSSYGVVRPNGRNGVLAVPKHPFQGSGASGHYFDSVGEAKQYLIDNAMDSDTRMSRAPMAESWPDLVLKKQLYDAASDPKVDYFGLPSGKGVQKVTGGKLAGQQQFYDKDQVARANKLLKKFGVGMEDADGLVDVANQKVAGRLVRELDRLRDIRRAMVEDGSAMSAYRGDDVNQFARKLDRMANDHVPELLADELRLEGGVPGAIDSIGQEISLNPETKLDRLNWLIGNRLAKRGLDFEDVFKVMRNGPASELSPLVGDLAKSVRSALGWANRSPASRVAKITPEMRQEILRKGFPLMSVALASLLGPQLMDEGA